MLELIKDTLLFLILVFIIYGSITFRIWIEFARIHINKRRKAKMNVLFGPSKLKRGGDIYENSGQ